MTIRTLILVLLAAVVLVVVAFGALLVQAMGSDKPELASHAPLILDAATDITPIDPQPGATATPASGLQDTPSPTAPAATVEAPPAQPRPQIPPPAPTATPPAAEVFHFAIDPSRSTATLVVSETIAGFPATASASARGISGDIYLTDAGLYAGAPSSFRMDLRTLSTSDALLKVALQADVLDTRSFPYAEFRLLSISGFPAQPRGGDEFSLTASGSLTLHGVTRPVTMAIKARQAGDILTATSDMDLSMSAFGISLPDVGLIKARDTVHVQVVFVAPRVG